MRIGFKTLFTLLMFIPFTAFCQKGTEVLVDIESTPLIKNVVSQKKSKGILALPFFDDFSRGISYPATELWQGNSVFVNTSYSPNTKSIGVATFDALNGNGSLHYQASTFPFSADTLLSRTINLHYPTDTTIYFSFYFQPQGLGYQPGIRDSLLLEFFDYNLDQWVGVWAAWADFGSKKLFQHDKIRQRESQLQSDTLSKTFFRVHFPVKDQRFLSSNFQFRFRNIASLSSNIDVPGLRGNSDHWHLDLVYLNRNRSYRDTLLNDITFSKPLGSILTNFESIPWKHFNSQAKEKELPFPIPFTISYRNLGEQLTPWNVTRRFIVKNNSDNSTYSFSGGSENVYALEYVLYKRLYEYDFKSNWTDSASFTFTSYLETDISPETSHLRWNDTVSYTQHFKNYYALDDGTSESGYGIYGEGTQNGRVAVKFTNYQADWLSGVYIYFNRTFLDANQKYFKLAVWDDNKGKPGNLVYEQSGEKPGLTNLNSFALYEFTDKFWLEPGVFYVGWIQTTSDMLNVGFDRNKNNSSKLFYNIAGSWLNTQFEGSLMLRPVFGELVGTSIEIPKKEYLDPITIYPNPATSNFSLNYADNFSKVSIAIYNIAGQCLRKEQYQNQPIDISEFAGGTYIVRIFEGNRIVGNQKLVVIR
jgi:hypothetical protein